MQTTEEVLFSVIERLEQFTSQLIKPLLVLSWLDQARAEALFEYYTRHGEIPANAKKEVQTTFVSEATSGCAGCKDVKILLDHGVVDLPGDIGIAVYLPGGKELNRVGSFSRLRNNSEFPKFLHGYAREQENILVIGRFAMTVELCVHIVPYSSAAFPMSDTFPAPSAMIDSITERAFEIATGKMKLKKAYEVLRAKKST